MLWKKGYSYKTKIRQQIGSVHAFLSNSMFYYNTSMLFTTCPCYSKINHKLKRDIIVHME